MTDKLIKESRRYAVYIGKPVNVEIKEWTPLLYKIVNKEHGIVEAETTMYPQMLKFLMDLESGIDALEDIEAEKTTAEVVPIHPGRPRH